MNRLSKLINKLNKHNEGLTLVEVMVSVTIFAIMIVPIVTQLNTLLRRNYVVKLSQAETDFATRVMEQFKEHNKDTIDLQVDEDGIPLPGNKTKAGYVVNDTDPVNTTYTMDNIVISDDVSTSSGNAKWIKNNTKYKVVVTLNSDAYKKTTGTNENDIEFKYQNPNDTKYYDMENIDDRYAILIGQNSNNYDSKASKDLIDKIAAYFKSKINDTNISAEQREWYLSRYNQWLNGVNFFKSVAYKKNTYVKVSYDKTKKKYYATVIISYVTDKYEGQTISYALMNNKEFDEKETGYKPPSIYVFYNQYVQNNQLVPDSDTLTIDNTGLAVGGSVPKNNKLKCFVLQNEAMSEGQYTYYVRDENNSESYGAYTTNNTGGSYVYEVKQGGSTSYLWPSFVIEGSDTMSSGDAMAAIGTDMKPGVIKYTDDDGNDKTLYQFDNILVPQSVVGAKPTSPLYTRGTGNGQYSYVCKKNYAYGSEGAQMKPGEIVYQRSDHKYVWPNGSMTNKGPSELDIKEYFNIAVPSKMNFNSECKLNILFAGADDSSLKLANDKPAIQIYTNLVDYDSTPEKWYVMSSTSGVSNIVSTGTDLDAEGSALKVNYQAIKNLKDYIKMLKDNLTTGDKRLYQIKLELYRQEGSKLRKIATLNSGKEG